MSTLHESKGRWLVSGLAAAAIAIAVLVIPISYQRTTGHEVSIAVTNAGEGQLRSIAGELKQALGVEHVMVKANADPSATTYTFEASVPTSQRVDAAAVANAFAKELTARGFGATATTTPIREQVSGNVYAYARDHVIRVETSGKSAAQIEAEIRQQLADAGLTQTQVSVTDIGDHERKVTVQAQHFSDKPGETEPENVRLELTKDGQPLMPGTGDGVSVQVKKMRTPDGLSLHLDVQSGTQQAAVDVAHADQMSDAALADAIKAQLAQKGITNVKVTVNGGEIQVERQ